MDYSVGSLADLISGSNTPNKPKVIKKTFKRPSEIDTEVKVNIKTRVIDKNVQEKNLGKPLTKENKFKKRTKNIKNISDKPNHNGNVTEQTESSYNNKSHPPKKQKDKSKKRKLESANSDAISDESSSPKRMKLNANKQNAERRIETKVKEENEVHDPEQLARTVYVGNVPITCGKKKLKKYFKKYGDIETIRIRGVPVANLKTPKKVAAIKKEFNPNRSNVFFYIRFVNKESALKAEAENGVLFEEHHLRVHMCASKEKPDETRAIFVGNLSFNAVEDELWKLFEPCGPISYVRIIRDIRTGMGKGFGYVNFMDSDAVQLALEMENIKLGDRELRISLCNLNTARKNKKNNKSKKITQPGKQEFTNKFNKKPINEAGGPPNEVKQINAGFQGSKFSDKNKKHKVNKGLMEKKKLVKKIAPKPK